MTIPSPSIRQKALFISFEGSEGVGKTTLIDHICQKLTTQNIEFIRTREPGGTAFGESMRKIMLHGEHICAEAELLALFAARAEHLHAVIMPALKQNKWVLCDRFIDSSIAYQGFGRYFGQAPHLQKIDGLIENFVTKLPDLTFWLDLDVQKGRMRAQNRSAPDRFEKNNDAFFARVHTGFLHQYQKNARIHRLDANLDANALAARAWHIINRFMQIDT